jgi:hypothetical protein
LVSHFKGRTRIESVSEKCPEEEMWTLEGGSKRRLRKTAQCGAS